MRKMLGVGNAHLWLENTNQGWNPWLNTSQFKWRRQCVEYERCLGWTGKYLV